MEQQVITDRRMHFISGLPRSGSTLLAALLSQNPRFHAGMSGPLAGMVNALQRDMSGSNEFSIFINDAQRERILRGLFTSYYGSEYSAEVIFDTNRVWCSKLETLSTLFPQSRVIACVRHVPWVYDSIEQLVRRNPLQHSSIFGYQSGASVYSRIDGLANGSDGLVGFSYNALREAFFNQRAASQLLILQYETLTSEPARAMAAVYDFLAEPHYTHDFNQVEFDGSEFDLRAGTPGMHRIHAKVAPVERKPLLPPDLFMRFENDSFWRNPAINLYGVKII